MGLALEEAKQASDRGEVPIGAVLVAPDSGEIIAKDGNRTIESKDPTAHAEILVIRKAAQILANERLIGTRLYVTLEPCTMCAGAISFARISELVFGALDPKGGAVESGARFFELPTCHHRPGVTAGIKKEESAQLLRDFFRARR
jgi:tRNA(Arg) A34 adenosine deaminase TadA